MPLAARNKLDAAATAVAAAPSAEAAAAAASRTNEAAAVARATRAPDEATTAPTPSSKDELHEYDDEVKANQGHCGTRGQWACGARKRGT